MGCINWQRPPTGLVPTPSSPVNWLRRKLDYWNQALYMRHNVSTPQLMHTASPWRHWWFSTNAFVHMATRIGMSQRLAHSTWLSTESTAHCSIFFLAPTTLWFHRCLFTRRSPQRWQRNLSRCFLMRVPTNHHHTSTGLWIGCTRTQTHTLVWRPVFLD